MSARRGEILHRLAEVAELEGASSQVVATLYLEAAGNISNPWNRALVRTNAGKAFARAGDRVRAEEYLLRAIEEADDDHRGIKSYAMLSLARLSRDPKSALSSINEALVLAVQSDQLELVVEARLAHAELLQQMNERQRAFDETAVAEAEAMRAGLRSELQRVRQLRGYLAAELGLARQNLAAWNRFLEEEDSEVGFEALCYTLTQMDEAGEQRSADLAWKNMISLADDRGAPEALAKGLLLCLEGQSVWNDKSIAIDFWLARLRSFLHGSELEKYHRCLALLEIRQILNDDEQVEKIPETLDLLEAGRFFDLAKMPIWSHLAEWLELHFLVVSGKRAQAAQRLRERLLDHGFRDELIRLVGDKVRRRGLSVRELPLPERTLVVLSIDVFGGVETVRALLDIFSKGQAGAILDLPTEIVEDQQFLEALTPELTAGGGR